MVRTLERVNHFDVLTAHPVSTPTEIEQRYRKRPAEFDPRAYPGAEPEHLEHLAAIRLRVELALSGKSNHKRRVSAPRDGNVLTRSLEDYLLAIYQLVRDRKVARVKDIARQRGVKPGSVSPAMKRLGELGLIRYQQREFIELTARGEAIARRAAARHQIICKFFRDVLQMDSSSAERDACAMEHSLSDAGMDRLTLLVEFVKTDPRLEVDFLELFHDELQRRNRRPERDGGERKKRGGGRASRSRGPRTLADLRTGAEALVVRIDAIGELRHRLLDMGVLPDAVVHVEQARDDDDRIVIRLSGFPVTLSREEAEAVLVSS